jgi:alanine dehydrogenase
LLAAGNYGLPAAWQHEPALLSGVNLYRGRLAHAAVAAALGRETAINLTTLGNTL